MDIEKHEQARLPALIQRASQRLANARDSAELLEARAAAEAALHYSRICKAANETQADCLRMIVRAEMRMADEVDAGQERGEVATREKGRPISVRTSDTYCPATYAEIGLDRRRIAEMRKVRDAGAEVVEDAISAALADGRAPTKADVQRKVAKLKRAEKISELEEVAAREIDEPTGIYDVIVIDPPWPMEKIEREVAPNQIGFDYPTMTEDEIASITIPAADDCHVWLWTTHKFLPMALRIIKAWRLKYVCTFVWHKPGGFQPFDLPQYNCEFALYARRGSPVFVETKAFPVCFNAPRGAHSEKPDKFYDLVRRVTAGRRIDMFNRRTIDGFTGWGKEA